VSRSIEPWLREILRCPACGGVLTDRVAAGQSPESPEVQFLDCVGACRMDPQRPEGRAYRTEDGIPVLLIDEALPSAP
jgi:uncharacterized protein YbaR (Trm112 family)